MFVDISPITGNKLTAQNIIDIHDDIIEIYGGTKGVLNQGTIDHLIYLLERKNDVFKKAALALKHIIVNHPFFDGNKRTAFEVTDILLRMVNKNSPCSTYGLTVSLIRGYAANSLQNAFFARQLVNYLF